MSLIARGEQSALTRAIRRWFGATPQQVRGAARENRDALAIPLI
ncbi:hypothetical protein [Nocardia sp. NPDC051832]